MLVCKQEMGKGRLRNVMALHCPIKPDMKPKIHTNTVSDAMALHPLPFHAGCENKAHTSTHNFRWDSDGSDCLITSDTNYNLSFRYNGAVLLYYTGFKNKICGYLHLNRFKCNGAALPIHACIMLNGTAKQTQIGIGCDAEINQCLQF